MFLYLNLQEEKIDELKTECEELKLSAEKASQNVKLLSLKLKRFESEPSPNAKMNQQLKKSEQQCSKLRSQLSDERTAKGQLEEKLSALSSEHEEKVKEIREKLDSVKKEKSQLEEDKETLQSKLQFSMNNSRKLENQVSSLQYKVIELEANDGPSDQTAPTQPAQGSCKCSEELSDLKEELAEVKEELEAKEEKAFNAMKKYSSLITRFRQLEREKETLTNKLKFLTTKRTGVQGSVDMGSKEVKKSEESTDKEVKTKGLSAKESSSVKEEVVPPTDTQRRKTARLSSKFRKQANKSVSETEPAKKETREESNEKLSPSAAERPSVASVSSPPARRTRLSKQYRKEKQTPPKLADPKKETIAKETEESEVQEGLAEKRTLSSESDDSTAGKRARHSQGVVASQSSSSDQEAMTGKQWLYVIKL